MLWCLTLPCCQVPTPINKPSTCPLSSPIKTSIPCLSRCSSVAERAVTTQPLTPLTIQLHASGHQPPHPASFLFCWPQWPVLGVLPLAWSCLPSFRRSCSLRLFSLEPTSEHWPQRGIMTCLSSFVGYKWLLELVPQLQVEQWGSHGQVVHHNWSTSWSFWPVETSPVAWRQKRVAELFRLKPTLRSRHHQPSGSGPCCHGRHHSFHFRSRASMASLSWALLVSRLWHRSTDSSFPQPPQARAWSRGTGRAGGTPTDFLNGFYQSSDGLKGHDEPCSLRLVRIPNISAHIVWSFLVQQKSSIPLSAWLLIDCFDVRWNEIWNVLSLVAQSIVQ